MKARTCFGHHPIRAVKTAIVEVETVSDKSGETKKDAQVLPAFRTRKIRAENHVREPVRAVDAAGPGDDPEKD